MKKSVCLILILVLVLGTCLGASAFSFKFWKKKNQPASVEQIAQVQDFEILPTMNTKSNAKNQVWVGTFQLVWNDLIDELLKQPVEFVGYKSVMAENLNKKSFSADELSENSYYKTWGLVSPQMKDKITNGIKEKFNETSDLLGGVDWTPAPRKYILYAMLKKDFEYIEKFAKLADGYFNGSEGEVKYFGLNRDSSSQVRSSIRVLFYNNSDDYAITLKSKQGDIVYLYRTNDDKTLDEYYTDVKTKSTNFKGKKFLTPKDDFKAPMIDFKAERQFPELCNKLIKNTDYILSQAIETIQFKMNEAGVKLKSEAIIVMKATSCLGPVEEPRYFYFNDKYVVFIEEEGKKPYYAMKITDVKRLQQT
ncbi:hypothetical protein IKQ21_05595 [bacterium]|nr:hypothetical protein [bacterium]